MKLRDGGTTILIIVAIAGAIGYFSSRFLGNDNLVEEQMEEIIEDQTGIVFDLSPGPEE